MKMLLYEKKSPKVTFGLRGLELRFVPKLVPGLLK